MRRTLIVVAIVIVLVGLGVVAYFYFFPGSPSVTVAPPGDVTLPTAGPDTNQVGVGAGPGTTIGAVTGAPTPVSARLVKISAGPVVPGEAVVDMPAANASSSPPSTSLGTGEVSVNFIERQSGNVFSYLAHAGTLTRTSNKTILGVESASWLPSGASAFVRYLSGADFSTVNTYSLPANDSGGQGFFLPQNLSDIAVSSTSPVRNLISNGASVLTLTSGVNGSVASLLKTDGTGSREVFTTPLSALRVSLAGKSQYLAFTKPSSSLAGAAYLVDSTGHFSRIAGPLNGLVALASPSGKFVLVSYVQGGAMQLELITVATGEILPLPVATIADKCVWSADESAVYCGIPLNPPATYAYPDDWYQGAVAFSDRIWKIDVLGRFAQMVLDFPTEAKSSLDAESLALDPALTTLVFVNKNDASLWAYSL